MGKFIDLTGKKFSRLTVISRTENDNSGQTRWNCSCDCGGKTVSWPADLKKGRSTNCGCIRKEKTAMLGRSKAHDLTGRVFSNLTVISRNNNSKKGAYWECLCVCGNSTVAHAGNLRAGCVKSCGCFRSKANGLSRTSEYYRNLRTKYMTDPLYVATKRIRGLVTKAFKGKGFSKTSKTCEILGCTFEQFKYYIESQFTDGMSWLVFDKIHIDHVIPLSSVKTIEEIIKLNHYTNLQPLWARDNLKKGAKLDWLKS